MEREGHPDFGLHGTAETGYVGSGESPDAPDIDGSSESMSVEGGKETPGGYPADKDTTADQSISAYDNFTESDYQFGRRSGVRAPSSISSIDRYVEQVESGGVGRDKWSNFRSGQAALAANWDDPNTPVDETSGRTDQMGAMGTSWARAEAARRQNRIDSVTPSLVDDWGMSEWTHGSTLGRKGALTDTDLAKMTARYERDRHGLLGSEGALDQARRANLVDAVMRAEATEQGTLSSQLERSRNIDAVRLGEESEQATLSSQLERSRNIDAVRKAEATAQGPLSSQLETSRNLDIARKEAEEAEEARFEKAITTDMSRLSELEKSLYAKEKARDKADSVHAAEREAFRNQTPKDWSFEEARLARQADKTASAIHDPRATDIAKDKQTERSMGSLQDSINRISSRETLFGLTYNAKDSRTRRQVQEMILDWEETYGDHLKEMGQRNSKAVNEKGFDFGKGLWALNPVTAGFKFFQGVANKLGIAYHPTNTEKQLDALRVEWGLDEREHGDETVGSEKEQCNARPGYRWNEETNSCDLIDTTPKDQAGDDSPSLSGTGILWKPVSEGDGNLVILTPQSTNSSSVSIVDSAGEVIEEGRNTGRTNGGRFTYRFTRPGSSFKGPVYLMIGNRK